MLTELLSADSVVRVFGSTVALDGVDVVVHSGRAVGLAGESGSGKTTLLRQMLDLDRPSAGTVSYRGTAISELDRQGRRRYRSDVQAVFQDPGTSLDPRWPIWRSVTEPLTVDGRYRRAELRGITEELLRSVGLPGSYVSRLPHQMSGGERQRAAVARALSTDPGVVLLDEPVTALDISVRGSILNLLRDMMTQRETTYVVVSHDLLAISYLTDHVYVMYRGAVVESGPTVTVLDRPQHPYAELLVRTSEDPLYLPDSGDEAAPEERTAPGGGCRYRSRCPYATDVCATAPELVEVAPDHRVACHHPRQSANVDVSETIEWRVANRG